MTLTPYLVAKHAEAAIAFYAEVFGATEDFRMTDPGDGRIGHAELRFAGAPMMLSDEYPDFGAVSPDTIGGTAVTLHLSLDDVDATVARAAAAGALVHSVSVPSTPASAAVVSVTVTVALTSAQGAVPATV